MKQTIFNEDGEPIGIEDTQSVYEGDDYLDDNNGQE